MNGPVYLDHHATTPCDRAVVDAMVPYFAEHFGNAGSSHTYGLRASAAVDFAREQVATLIGAEPREIVFTSGATESNNLAILGLAEALGRPAHLITCATEHKAVLDPVRHLVDRLGWTATVLDPSPDGRLTPDALRDALRDDTALVTLMTANNETGMIHPIEALGAVCRDRGIRFHTDAAQATGRVPLDVRALPVDLMSLTAHKTYGPKGIGALWIRKQGRPRVALKPRQLGGSQEGGLRSGTLPVPLIVGMGKACALAADDLASGENARLAGLRDRMWQALQALGGVHLSGTLEHRLPHNLHVTVEGVRAANLLMALRPDVACSAGSACSTRDPKPSHVLTAMGVPAELALGAVRFGLGRSTTPADVDRAIQAVTRAVRTQRAQAVAS